MCQPIRCRPKARVARVLAHTARQRYLIDHRIQGNVVLPIVQALEWFVQMAEACRPGQCVHRISDIRVLRGVTLSDFDQRGDALLVGCATVEDHPHRLACTLSDASGSTAYYSATVDMGSGSAATATPEAVRVGDRRLNRDTCYTNGALFHGPAFQVLESVDCQASAATAVLYGLTMAGWSGEGWVTDPAALDGCLQTALVWSFEQLGAMVLPLRVGEIVRYRAAALGDGTFMRRSVNGMCGLGSRNAGSAESGRAAAP